VEINNPDPYPTLYVIDDIALLVIVAAPQLVIDTVNTALIAVIVEY
jgi:hypothetical protein